MTILAIDPGNTHSGVALIDPETRRPLVIAKLDNETLLADLLRMPACELGSPELVVIEMVQSFGMAVGHHMFETCVWIGRFMQAIQLSPCAPQVQRAFRLEVKKHHTHRTNANDAVIIQALCDRFAPGQPNRGKGTKKNPGWFYGFKADIWQAYALAVYAADAITQNQHPPLGPTR